MSSFEFASSMKNRRKSSNPTVRAAVARAVVEFLEGRQLLAVDPFASENLVQTLPFVDEFDGSATSGLLDKDNAFIGLTRVQVNKNGRDATYIQSNLDQVSGTLKITTTGNATNGSNYNGDNTLTNGVETTFDASTGAFQITTRLVGPLGYIAAPSDQAGISFGPDEDNYVKLVAVSRPEGQRLQFTDEQLSGTTYNHVLDNVTDVGSFSSLTSLDLRLTANPTTGVVSAYYAKNGGAFTKLSADLTLSGTRKTQFFNATAKAGLIALNKNNNGPIVATFDRFAVEPVAVTARPSVRSVDPSNGATGVLRNAFVGAQVNLTAGGIDTSTLNSTTVKLYRTSDHAVVSANVGTSGGGDVIILTPTVLLDQNTSYTFEVTDSVKDVAGNAFQPFTSSFTTGTTGGEIDPSFSFEKVALSTAVGEQFTCLKVGPDGKLYAGDNDGRIFRYPINADGTLGAPQIITTLQTANGGKRLLTGFAFDPASTATNIILWVNHGQYRFGSNPNSTVDSEKYADDWTGKLTKLVSANANGIGTDLGKAVDVLTGLPRSARDHLNNQPVFGPDGALYFAQGAMNSGGAPDTTWANRSEHLLSSAILRLDPTKLPATLPLNVKTSEGGGTYNPSAAGAPLTIYAKGVRNAFDLVWTKDGFLYAPTNGSAAGGNTPGTTGVPALTNIDVQHDFLYKIQQGGYYGHPDPLRGDYVLGGGYTPADGVGPDEVPEYGSTIQPDSEYKGYAYDFGTNISPDGVLEYQNTSTFGGHLAGKLIVTRYSGPDDLIVLTKDSSGAIVQSQTGITGTSGLADPLDVTEDPSTGNLYVSEYSDTDPTKRKITLLRPIPAGADATPDKQRLVFTDIQTSSMNGTGASAAQTVTIRNTGTQPLTIPAGGVTIVDDPSVANDDSSQFLPVNWPGLPATVPVGESISFSVKFQAASIGMKAAILRIQSNDATNPTLNINLRGIGTSSNSSTGDVDGTNEPSLQRILNAYQIPVNVGDADGEATSNFPTPRPAGTPNDEISMQRMVKAGAGPVVIQTLAAYEVNTKTGPASRFGYYAPGTPDAKTELFTISAANHTSTTPGGGASFDPGSAAFALYQTFNSSLFQNTTTGLQRSSYSEDAFNTWATTSKTKFRFFPLKNADGSVEPNAYVFATEDFDGTTSASFDSNDLVGIIRNVKPAGSGPEIGTQNLDRGSDGVNVRSLPPTVLTFNRVQLDPTPPTPDNVVHDTANLRIYNSGDQPLTINSVTLGGASPGSYQILSGPANGSQIGAGGSADVSVKFIAQSGSPNVKNATLLINSNDADEPVTTIQLNGYWQNHSENNEEPSLQTIVSMFGFGTTIVGPGQVLADGGKVERVGDEVLSGYWTRVDPTENVDVIELASYHTQGNTAAFKWFYQGQSGTTPTLFTSAGADAQSVLPHINGGPTVAAGTIKPTTQNGNTNPAFGFKVDGEWSDDTLNTQEQSGGGFGHHVRFWVAKDSSGNVIPGTYIMGMDYLGINYDYEDNVYLIRNVQPVKGPSAPTGATATASGGGIFLDWSDNTEANLAGYNVYRGTTSTFTPSSSNKINTTGLLSASDFNDVFAPSGTTTYYAISAVDSSGNESGFTRVSATRTSDTTPPATPANLNVMGSASAITLDWDNNTEADLAGYNVSRSTSANGTFTQLNTGGLLTTSSYIDGSATTGVTYFYRVVAVDQSGNVSSAATGSGTRGTVTTPAAPQNLVASGTGATTASLTWSPSSGATDYRVERKGPSDADFVEIAPGVTTTSFNDTALTPGTAYQYRVRAENSAGLSGYSNVSTATTTGVGQSGFTGTAIATTGSFSTITDGSAYDVTAGPGMINGTSDAFYFVSKQVTGDFDVKVRIDGIVNGNTYSRGGIMARATNDANSAEVDVSASLADGFRTARRIVTGGDTAITKTGTPAFPNAWVRLQRVGNQIGAYYGSDGTTWNQIFSLNIVLPQTLQLGMATGAWTTTSNVTVRYRDFGDTNPQQPQLPGAPSSLQASAPTSDTVNLSWVAGSNASSYRVERRVQGDANFTEIASNVTGTSFQDAGRAANTAYEYQVRSENSAGLSGYSNIASVTTPASTPVDGGTYEAEDAVLVGAVKATGFSGYTGSGFVDYINPSGDYVEFQNVSSATTGTRTLRLRYALQATNSRTLNVTVNGVAAGTVTFTPTASWTTWGTIDINESLVAGNNIIRLTASGQSGPNFDNLSLVTAGNPPPPDGGTFEAESATLSGAVQSSEESGFNGTGYADYINLSGDFVEFQNVPANAAGNRTLRFRFANGSTASRTLNLTINGVSAGTVTFAPTGSWTTWSTIDVSKALAAGNNVIRLTASGQSGPNLDSLIVL